jgi:hypothetical protein
MKRICVAGQKAMNARREAQLDAGTSSKPSNKAGALFGRNPQGRRLPRHGKRSLGCGSGSMSTPRLTLWFAAARAPSRTTLRETESGVLSAHAFVARPLIGE